jgi:hypothetical protein
MKGLLDGLEGMSLLFPNQFFEPQLVSAVSFRTSKNADVSYHYSPAHWLAVVLRLGLTAMLGMTWLWFIGLWSTLLSEFLNPDQTWVFRIYLL